MNVTERKMVRELDYGRVTVYLTIPSLFKYSFTWYDAEKDCICCITYVSNEIRCVTTLQIKYI